MNYICNAKCSISKARSGLLPLAHAKVDTPIFMPVGTQGTVKGLTPEQLYSIECKIILGNTYHLGNRPGVQILEKASGLHKFMNWERAILTDSGGFQMVSLLKLAEITEEGVKFRSPHENSEMLLTPEESIRIQNIIGADVIMQLDDVVSSLTTGPRVEEAMHRSIRWLDRCIKTHEHTDKQKLFGIVQGGLEPELRKVCISEMIKRDLPGYAIGGLSGGEEKDKFWKIVSLCTDLLPQDKPRYLMGVGYPLDLVVCAALGVDMFDCVYPTRTARFGSALVPWGVVNLKKQVNSTDFNSIDESCDCYTCKHLSRSLIHCMLFNKEPTALSYITLHNINYLLRLMENIRAAIEMDKFPQFVCRFMETLFPHFKYPCWAVDALASVNIHLKSKPMENDTQGKKNHPQIIENYKEPDTTILQNENNATPNLKSSANLAEINSSILNESNIVNSKTSTIESEL